MNEKLNRYLRNLAKNEEVASEETIRSIQQQLDFSLPKDYIELMRIFNGGEGEIGESSWLCLFPVEELIQTNKDYNLLMEQIPDYFLFGKDAADTGYAFKKSDGTIHSFGLMSDFNTDPIEFCGKNILEFVEYLYNQ